jgi:hypothetical protein
MFLIIVYLFLYISFYIIYDSIILPSYDTQPFPCFISRSDIYTVAAVSNTSVVLTTLCETEVCIFIHSLLFIFTYNVYSTDYIRTQLLTGTVDFQYSRSHYVV